MSTETPIQPLRGPLGVKEILFTRWTSPLVARIPRRIRGIIFALVVSAAVGFVLWPIFRSMHRGDLEVVLWFFTLVGLIFSELFLVAVVPIAVAAEVKRWRTQRRLAEIFITLLRPVTIGQLIIAGPIRTFLLVLLLTFGAAAFCLRWHHPGSLVMLLPWALVALNGAVAIYTFAWAQLAISLHLGRGIRSFMAMTNFTHVYTLTNLPVVLASVIYFAVMLGLTEDFDGFPQTLCFAIAPFGTAALIAIKLLHARAFAARLEQAVFPQLTL